MKIDAIDHQTLRVTGITELSAGNAAQVREELRTALQSESRHLELDMSGTTFLDSSGLGALISLHKAMRGREGALRIINPSPSVQQILELTRLHRVLEIVKR